MAAKILNLYDDFDEDYKLIAIHTVLQDYKLAYLLNKELGFTFDRIVPDLDYIISDNKVFFSAFKHHENKELVDFFLIKNKFKVKNKSGKSIGLFDTDASFASTYVYLQPEVKEADYILKVQGDFLDIKEKELLQVINKTKGVITAYSVDVSKLNYKEYLIF